MARSGQTWHISPSAYRRLTLVTLISLVLIIGIGASVRLTGSGMGCPTWPSCQEDRLVPHAASDYAGMIEFGNRLAGMAVGALALAAVVGAHRRSPRRQDLFRWSLLVAGLVIANGLLGAQVVWLHLSPIVVAGHFLLALAALWAGVVLHHRASEASGASEVSGASEPAGGPGPVAPSRRPICTPTFRRACNALMVAAAATVIIGTVVTGSGPHAGDEDAERFSFAVGEVARIHGITAAVFLGTALLVLWMAQRGDASVALEGRLQVLVLVVVAQGIIGYTQYFTGVPTALVGTHVVGSALVWIAVLRVRLGLTEPLPAGTPTATPLSPASTSSLVQPAIAETDAGARNWDGCQSSGQSRPSPSRSTSRSTIPPTISTDPGS